MRNRREAGFTLVELMVVIVLIGLLAGAVSVAVFPLEKGKITAAKQAIGTFEEAMAFYRMEYSRYPDSLDELVQPTESNPEGFLEDLEIPQDPWGELYIYDPQGGSKKQYLIISMGPDRIEGTDDDVTNETNLNQKPQ